VYGTTVAGRESMIAFARRREGAICGHLLSDETWLSVLWLAHMIAAEREQDGFLVDRSSLAGRVQTSG